MICKSISSTGWDTKLPIELSMPLSYDD